VRLGEQQPTISRKGMAILKGREEEKAVKSLQKRLLSEIPCRLRGSKRREQTLKSTLTERQEGPWNHGWFGSGSSHNVSELGWKRKRTPKGKRDKIITPE
jgi:hypothetical protein